VACVPFFHLPNNRKPVGRQAMKKPSRKQPINDFPPLKKAIPRKATRAMQQHLADLRAKAALRQYLPEEERSEAVLVETSSGTWRELPPVRDTIERMRAGGYRISS